MDGGLTWHPASGQGNWSYVWTVPGTNGSINIKSRAVDDSGNTEIPSGGTTVTIGGGGSTCESNCTLWSSTAGPTKRVFSGTPDRPVELGVKFRSEIVGEVTGVRFYKLSGDPGTTRVGHLWSGTGQLLASATFAEETASGWQQVDFLPPVSISPNTVYVASYHSAGYYAADTNYFTSAGVDNPPLHALANGGSVGNGVYAYGAASLFPNLTFNAANYWVDVVFSTVVVPSLVIDTASLPGATVGVAYSATLAASGGSPPYTWSISSGALPVGLTLQGTGGVISGVPTAAGLSSFTVGVGDHLGRAVSKALNLSTAAGPVATPIPQPVADLAMAMSAPKAVRLGQPVTYGLRVTNKSKIKAPSVVVTDHLPSTVTVLKAPGYCAVSGIRVVCELGVLGKKKSKRFAIKVKPTVKGLITNVASVGSSSVTDTHLANNSTTRSTAVKKGIGKVTDETGG